MAVELDCPNPQCGQRTIPTVRRAPDRPHQVRPQLAAYCGHCGDFVRIVPDDAGWREMAG